ncbi:MAG TPA: phosphoglycolate phosphatase [Pseudomonadales bacterium]|nr:phosphoglycolate phosphatase [Pseudomonadales bacterium]
MMKIKNLFDGDLPKLVVFDLDGTLIDSVPDITVAIDKMLTSRGYSAAGEENVRNWVGNGAKTLVKRALRYANVESDPGQPEFDEAFDAYQAFYKEKYCERSTVYQGVKETLDAFKAQQIPMAVATNKGKHLAQPILEAIGLAPYFETVIGGDCLPRRKPHPDALLHIAELLGVAPEQSLMVGDSKNDVGAARAAGYKVVCYKHGYNYGEDVALVAPDLLFDQMDEIVS